MCSGRGVKPVPILYLDLNAQKGSLFRSMRAAGTGSAGVSCIKLLPVHVVRWWDASHALPDAAKGLAMLLYRNLHNPPTGC